MTSVWTFLKSPGEFPKGARMVRWYCLVTLLAVVCLGCRSSRVNEPAGGVSIELRGNTPGQIFMAAQEVYATNGYYTKLLSPLRMWCEKPASKMSNLAYGDWLPGNPLYIRVKLTLVEHGEAQYRLHSQAFKLTDRGGLLEEEKLIRSGTGTYKKLLDELAAHLRGSGGYFPPEAIPR
jgi:hypothetical protein